MANEMRLIDAKPLMQSGWHLVQTGESNRFIQSMSLADIPTVDAKPVVHGQWINWGKSGTPTYENYGTCSVCHEDAEIHTEHRNYCPNCGAQMDGDGNG